MAWLILGQNLAPLPIDEVRLGAYRLTRVAADDPAVRDALDPAWSLTDVLVLHTDGEPPPWERRVAKELLAELAGAIGAARPVTLACPPTPVPPPRSPPPPPRPALETDELAAWIREACDPDGFVRPERRPATLPHGAVDVSVYVVPVSPSELGELTAAIRRDRDAALPDAYLETLLEVGAIVVEWLDADGERCAYAEMLTPRAVRDEIDRHERVDAMIPFYCLGDQLDDDVFAFDPSTDPPTVVGHSPVDDDIRWTGLTFSQWLALWLPDLGATLSDRIEPVDSPPPLGAAALARQWRTIAAWVRPMYDDWDATQSA